MGVSFYMLANITWFEKGETGLGWLMYLINFFQSGSYCLSW